MLCGHTRVRVVEEAMIRKSYDELIKLKTFEERYRYLKLSGVVGKSTFGFDRYKNQQLYTSGEWRRVRDLIIIRDGGCDLAFEGREIHDMIIIHHMNPVTEEQIANNDLRIFNLDGLISTTDRTHQAIHYGDESLLITLPPERTRGDTSLW